MEIMTYKHGIELFKLYNSEETTDDWVGLNFQQNFNDRCENVMMTDNSRLRVGKNILPNRLRILNNRIKLEWLNLSKDSFKIRCKNTLLP